MILILVIVDNGLVRACFRSNNVLLCLVLILVVVDNGLVPMTLGDNVQLDAKS